MTNISADKKIGKGVQGNPSDAGAKSLDLAASDSEPGSVKAGLIPHMELVSGTIRPQGDGLMVAGPGFSEMLSLFWDSAGLQTYRPVMKMFRDAIEQQLPGELKESALNCLSKSNQNYQVPFWSGERLDIVVRELLVNALRSIADRKASGLIRFSLSLEGSSLRIQIADNGKGVSDKIAQQIFTEGFTTKRGSEADVSGNGLYRSRRMVAEIFAGTVSLGNLYADSKSLKPAGAVAEVSIPLREV